jgi:hypothetical protein
MIPNDIRERLRQIEEEAEKATPGPWAVWDSFSVGCGRTAHDAVLLLSFDEPPDDDDADFIASSRTNVPDLVSWCRELLKQRDRAERTVRACPCGCTVAGPIGYPCAACGRTEGIDIEVAYHKLRQQRDRAVEGLRFYADPDMHITFRNYSRIRTDCGKVARSILAELEGGQEK